MGDHRVTIRIIWEMHGHKADSGEMWCNGSSYEALPSMARDWLEEQHRISMQRWDDEQFEAEQERKKEETEKNERAELSRLKAKYESAPVPSEPPPPDQS